jgi:LmbE family N-acetylglucosaminyl deacetylase
LIGLDLPAADPLGVLAIGAHADDIEIGAGGLLLEWLGAGRIARLDWVVLSAVDERAEEARASATDLVAGRAPLEVSIGAFRERFFPHQPEVKDYVDDLGRRIRPDVVLAPRLEDRHQDHRTTAELVWQAFRDQLVLEYEIVKYEGDLGTPNLYVPLAAATVGAKVAHLMAAFPSQRHRPWYDPSAFQAITRLRGIECNAPSGHAEAFTGRKVVLAATPTTPRSADQ